MTSTGSILLDLLGVATALIVIAYAYLKWTYQYWKRRGVPYLEPTMPYGNFQSPSRRTISIGDNCAQLYRSAKAKGWRHAGVFMMTSPNYLVLDLDLVKHIMTKDFNHFVDRGVYTNERDDPLSCHLFSIGGTKWRNLRTKLTPTFTSGKMKAMFQTLVDCGLVLEQYLEDNVKSNEPVDIKEILGRFSTDIIGSCAFGIDCNTFKEPNSPFRTYGKKSFSRDRSENAKIAFCLAFPDAARALGLRFVRKDVSDFFMKVVQDTVAYREKNNFVRKDFMQLLINLKNNKESQEHGYKGDGKTLTMDELAAQCFVFFLAGFETSSTTMTFALFELATHPDIQDKVREEIRTVLAKHDNQMTYDSLSELKYMGQVIDETLRLHPPVPFVTRECVEDYKVPGEDVIIEKGTRVLICIQGIHYDEEYYKNPRAFDPERFTEENKKTRHHYAHIPFGEGPRICIGERFGVMQTKVGLTSLLRKFKVTLNEKTKVPLKMSVRSFVSSTEGDIWLNLEKI